ncbi:hypothetical protein LZQ00_01485 [Sphingobacterium sp. SRCM116780]|uniref:hypothetical protein n=1 Tax=Sphingobacterium sp. SRCM116780 TaxID=2907623 RepID=UPI001F21BEA9|nr:hypothetical protein [Sphingobacterium sp. SRCM116780]UIR56505.1 hypothetical protein LZQ00_01485 [Sphingobacterium sp. SRCM116780]
MNVIHLPIKRLIFFITLLSLGNIIPVKAQFSIPPSRISTPYGKVNIPGVYSPRIYSFNGASPVSGKYDFTIVLLNDSSFTTKTKIKIDLEKNHCDLNWKSKGIQHTITPKETKEIYRTTFDNRRITGIPLDTCWAFLIDSGKIRTYSITSDFNSPTICYIQSGKNGKLLALTPDNLRPLIGDNPAVLKLVDKNKLLKAIKDYNNR